MIIWRTKSRIDCPHCGDRMYWTQTLLVAFRECGACGYKDKPMDSPAIPVLLFVNKFRKKMKTLII